MDNGRQGDQGGPTGTSSTWLLEEAYLNDSATAFMKGGREKVLPCLLGWLNGVLG